MFEENPAKIQEVEETPLEPFQEPVLERKQEEKQEEKVIMVQKPRKQKLVQQTLNSFFGIQEKRPVDRVTNNVAEKELEKASEKVGRKTKPIQKKQKKERRMDEEDSMNL